MSSQRFVPWTPVTDAPAMLYCESIHDGPEGLRIVLRGPAPSDRVLQLTFESMVGYRNINESWRARTWQDVDTKALPTLLRVEGSRWLAWLVEEAGGALVHAELVHYAIYTPEDCIDVVSEFPPEVTWLDPEQK